MNYRAVNVPAPSAAHPRLNGQMIDVKINHAYPHSLRGELELAAQRVRIRVIDLHVDHLSVQARVRGARRGHIHGPVVHVAARQRVRILARRAGTGGLPRDDIYSRQSNQTVR
ncbi:hypothetical protein CF640_37850, partial [Burkholderia pseudomallei]